MSSIGLECYRQRYEIDKQQRNLDPTKLVKHRVLPDVRTTSHMVYFDRLARAGTWRRPDALRCLLLALNLLINLFCINMALNGVRTSLVLEELVIRLF